ncbi:Uncharacterised protein [Mycobacterium tuberculosis]|nr:Uncharacterised protein [Mycobacterium tuberculosis]
MNVALRRFQALGLIRLEKRGLTVLDLGGLRGYQQGAVPLSLGG